MKIKSILITTLALTVICTVATAALAFTNALTKEKIAEVEKRAAEQAMERVIPAQIHTPIEVETDGVSCYRACDADGTLLGYVFTTSAHGYGGAVSVMTGIDTEGKIIAIEVLDASEETPGLGQNAAKESFWEQFRGKSDKIVVVKNNPDETQVQALTGATITSNAVRDAVNTALDEYSKIAEGAENNG